MATATVTSKGQITIPREVRLKLGLRTGDRVDFLMDSEGNAILKPVSVSVSHLKGILHRKGMKPVTLEQMNESIKSRWKKRA